MEPQDRQPQDAQPQDIQELGQGTPLPPVPPPPSTPPPPPPPVGGRPSRAWWLLLLVPFLLLLGLGLAGALVFYASDDSEPDTGGSGDGGGGGGGGGDCADLQPVVDVTGHTEEMDDPELFPGQYDITVQLTITNPGDDPIQIGGIDLAMAGAPDVRVYGSGDQDVLAGGETRSFEAVGPITLDGGLLPVPDESSATVEWFYEDSGDYVC